jgi:hypothetical protein
LAIDTKIPFRNDGKLRGGESNMGRVQETPVLPGRRVEVENLSASHEGKFPTDFHLCPEGFLTLPFHSAQQTQP